MHNFIGYFHKGGDLHKVIIVTSVDANKKTTTTRPSSNKKCHLGVGAGSPYNGLYGEAPPERGTFFSPRIKLC